VGRVCSAAWRCKSSAQPDGREVIATRRGRAARGGLKEAWTKDTGRCTRTGSEAYGVGRVGNERQSPYPSRTLVVNPAVAYRKQPSLSREIWHVADSRLRVEKFSLILPQKSAAGVLLTSVRKAQTVVGVVERRTHEWHGASQSAWLSFTGSDDGEAETVTCRAAKPLWRKTHRTSGPQGLHLRNRPVRTRMPGGVAGESGQPLPLRRFR
jgi:hypothetical protein